MAPGSKPPGTGDDRGGDDESVDIDDLFGDLFEDAPATDPVAPLAPLDEAPPDPAPFEERRGGRDAEEITLEIPAARQPSPFDPDVPVEIETPAPFAPPLPEMDAEIWQAGLAALVSVPESAAPVAHSAAEWLDEATLYRAETGAADSPLEAAALWTAAGRAAEAAGEPAEAAQAYDEALTRAPASPDALRARGRLAEAAGDLDEAHAMWARLALSAELPDERAHYAALSAEWTLARRGSLPAVALDAIPAGPARALAQAEEALRSGPPAAAAPAFAAAGRALGGAAGGAFLQQAARFAAVAGDASAAAALRTAAERMTGAGEKNFFAALRDAARLDPRTALGKVAELVAAAPAGSALTLALARWGAALARQRGDAGAARALLQSAGASTQAAARDLIDLDRATGAPLDEAGLTRLREGAASPAAAATLAWIEAGERLGRGELAMAAELLAPVIEAQPDAVPLALLAEEIAARTSDPALRATALDLWLRGDPARRADVARVLAEALETAGSGLAARAALQTAVEAAPESTAFWLAAAADARAGRRPDATATLAYGADVWEASALAAPLRGMAAAKLGPTDPARALETLGANADGTLSAAARALGAEATARLAERTGDRRALGAALSAAAVTTVEPNQRAALALRRAAPIPPDETEARARALDEALAAAPTHPVALGLALSEPGTGALFDAARAASLLTAAAGNAAAGKQATWQRTASLAATEILVVGDDQTAVWSQAAAGLTAVPGDRELRGVFVRAAHRQGNDEGRRALAALPFDPPGADEARTLQIAEARIDADVPEGAAEALRAIAGGRFAADARRDAARVGAFGAETLPPGLLFSDADQQAATVHAALASLGDGAAVGRAEELAGALAGAPPHEAAAGPATLAFASLIAELGDAGVAAERLAEDAVRATPPGGVDLRVGEGGLRQTEPIAGGPGNPLRVPGNNRVGEGGLRQTEPIAGGPGNPLRAPGNNRVGEGGLRQTEPIAGGPGNPLRVPGNDDAPPLLTLARVADAAGETALRRRAFSLVTAQLGAAESDRRAAAGVLGARARLEEAAGEPAAAVESWRAALGAEPAFLPAARALRLAAARGGDPAGTSAACEVEAACLMVPAHRVRALLLAAALAAEARPPAVERALALLRAALALDPAHDAAFERLRALLAERGDAPALAASLAARIDVAQNPFEITSLRLARAELLAGPLDDRAGARAELFAVLRKQPDHARALERLSELLWTDQAFGEAGEIYLKRAVVEREPATLRAIFLRLGEIYSRRVPDVKRAAAAYERVLGVDAGNLEALRALSDLYLNERELKRALPVTERLVEREPDAAVRHHLRIRLGGLLMQTGDLRRAATELRRVVDEAPRDVPAVTALAQLLERARDHAGRRAVLDRAVGLLRHDLARPEGLTVETLRALASLLAMRDRPHSALAAAQLVAALGAGTREGVRAAARPARSLAGLRRSDLDERAFSSDVPPGIRQLLRAFGPLLRPTGQELAQRLGRHGVTRAERRGRGAPPRPVFDDVAAELGLGEIDLYVRLMPAAAGPIPLRAEPGTPPSLVIGAALEELGPTALRFAAGRTLRLSATHLDTILAVSPEEAGAMLVAIIRQFVPDYQHRDVRESLVTVELGRAERAMPRKLKGELMPFAVESAGPFDLPALYAAVRDGANAAGLLASADLPASLSVILEIAGTIVARPTAGGPGLTLAAIAANQEAWSLVRFAVSDEHDDLARELESE